ncbi:hypothetical protein PIROE2DRAFT_17086 [Piromyces sp. E2]|nr:hypothetical protein PIROE2DRAFT_17086 [Piromyces sp. E2]|eukprot:OUM57812.1 hypothetical protein PIROE2DRAFT_17086 [Piromyces sp. E2]
MTDVNTKYSFKIILKKAIKLIENGFLEKNNLEQLSRKLRISTSQLENLFNVELNITPQQYLYTFKLNIAEKLLVKTNLDIGQIALSLGFKNLERFRELYKEKYKVFPEIFRKNNQKQKVTFGNTITIDIQYQTPFRYEEILSHLRYFSVKGVEKIESGKYYKTIHIKNNSQYVNGYIIVGNNEEKNCLEVEVSSSLILYLSQVFCIVKNIFDLNSDPKMVYDVLKSSNQHIKNCFRIGTRIPGSADDFEICVRAVVGQLVSMKNAADVLCAFCQKFGDKVETNIDGLEYVFPTPETINGIKNEEMYDEICSLHIIRTKADAITGIAKKFCDGVLDIKYGVDAQEVIRHLNTIKGVGKWTSDYIATRAIDYSDIIMETDYTIRKIFEKEGITDTFIFEKYSPFRSHLTVGLFALRDVLLVTDTIYKTSYSSPVGSILIACKKEKIVGLWIEGQKNYLSNFKEEEMKEREDDASLVKVKNWLDRYFNHESPAIDELDLAPIGTKLRQDIWNILKTVPYGRIITFENLSKKLIMKRGIKRISPKAVKDAISHNPISIIIPCHRVIGTNGNITGYANSIKTKAFLMKHERNNK